MKKSATARPFLKFLNFFILFAFDYLVKMMKTAVSDFFKIIYLFFICKFRKKTKNRQK